MNSSPTHVFAKDALSPFASPIDLRTAPVAGSSADRCDAYAPPPAFAFSLVRPIGAAPKPAPPSPPQRSSALRPGPALKAQGAPRLTTGIQLRTARREVEVSDTDRTLERNSPDASGPLPQFSLGGDDSADTDRTLPRAAVRARVTDPSDTDRTLPRQAVRPSADASGPLPQFDFGDASDADRTLERPTLTAMAAIPLIARPSADRTEEIDAVEEIVEELSLGAGDLLDAADDEPEPSTLVRPIVRSAAIATPRGIAMPRHSTRIEFVDEPAVAPALVVAPSVVSPSPAARFAPRFSPEKLDFADLSSELQVEPPGAARRRRIGYVVLAGVVAIASTIGAVALVHRLTATRDDASTSAPARRAAQAANDHVEERVEERVSVPEATTITAATTTIAAATPATVANPPAIATTTAPPAATKGRSSTVAPAAAKVSGGIGALGKKGAAALAAPAVKKPIAPVTTKPVAKAAATKGTILTTPAAAGHRMFVDGILVGDAPKSIGWTCGTHWVRIGSTGPVQQIVIPCGGSIVVPYK